MILPNRLKTGSQLETIEIGVDEQHRKRVAGESSKLLADTYTLYLKTHNYHWNVVGPMFSTLHLLLEKQYTELALAVDVIAERIRSLGQPVPGSYRQFSELTVILEDVGHPNATEMIRRLVDDNQTVVHAAYACLPLVLEAGDQPMAVCSPSGNEPTRRLRGC